MHLLQSIDIKMMSFTRMELGDFERLGAINPIVASGPF
jgi:hypothetical protein